MTPFFADGRELDDFKPQDIAEALADVFDKLAKHFDNDGKPAFASEMRRGAELTRAWVKFGHWFTKDDLRNVARHAAWLNAREVDRMQNLVTYEDADQAVKEYLDR